MSWVYLNGALVRESEAKIPATDRGLLFGRGLFETFRAIAGRPIYRLAEHMARLEAGAAFLGIPMAVTRHGVEDAAGALMDRCGLDDARVRLTLTAGPEGGSPSVLIQARAATDYPPEMYRTGVAAVIARVRRNETSPLSRFKSLSCLDNILAREEARAAGAVEAILLNTRGTVAEGSVSNVFIVRGGGLVTPPVEDGALPGVTRGAVLEMAQEADIPARERSVTREELLRADEAFVTNSVACVLPLSSIHGAAVGSGSPGEVTRVLGDALARDMSRPEDVAAI